MGGRKRTLEKTRKGRILESLIRKNSRCCPLGHGGGLCKGGVVGGASV